MLIPMLMYHRVCDDADTPSSRFTVRRRTFERHLAWLVRRGYRSVRWDDAIAPKRAGVQAQRDVLITFDDGYVDNHEHAFELLMKYRFSATIFAVTDFSRRCNWWDADAGAGARLLKPQQIREMAACGVSFGAHGMMHQRMDVLSSRARRAELRASRCALEDVLGAPVQAFAWPYGAVNDACKADAQEVGYTAAFAVNSGALHGSDPYEVRRTFMGDCSGNAYLFRKISGVETTARWAWGMVKGHHRADASLHATEDVAMEGERR